MNRNKEILCLKIEISPGHKELLKVHEEDEPEVLALEFCHKFKIDPKFQEGLSNLIEFHIDTLLDTQIPYRQHRVKDFVVNEEKEIPLVGDNNKLDLYYDLFEELADPEVNSLSYETGRFKRVSKVMQRILEPIFEELKESGEAIGFSEFTRAMDLLLTTLNARDKVLVLNNHLEGGKGGQRKAELKKEIEKLKTLKESRASTEPYSKVISLKGFYHSTS